MSIKVNNLHKSFGNFQALNDVSFEVRTGELVALLGPSGSGKTTLLHVIAGLEHPDEGSVIFHGEDATSRSARERNVGFVFQHYALFKHMSVADNIAFGLRVRPRAQRPSNDWIKSKVDELLGLVQLGGLGRRFPAQLSGGQRQRVALARALAVEPKILLLDEPFGALDARVRVELRRWLKRLHEEIHVTSVFVTHDQEEALEVADRVVIMNHGRIEQIGTPEEVYDHPASPFVYNFLGTVNLFHGRIEGGQAHLGVATMPVESVGAQETVVGYVRPHDLWLDHQGSGIPTIPAVIRTISLVGPTVRVELERKDTGGILQAEISRERAGELTLAKGDEVQVSARQAHVFANEDPAANI